VFRLFGSNKKLKEHTPWMQKFSLAQGLTETIAWFRNKENLALYKSDIYNL
jgi:dTDP-D-glucose 4,6-dehydratase